MSVHTPNVLGKFVPHIRGNDWDVCPRQLLASLVLGADGAGARVTIEAVILGLEGAVLHPKLVEVVVLALVERGGGNHHLPDAMVLGGFLDEFVETVLEAVFDLVVLGLNSVHSFFHEHVQRALHALAGLGAELANAKISVLELALELAVVVLEVLDGMLLMSVAGSCFCPCPLSCVRRWRSLPLSHVDRC